MKKKIPNYLTTLRMLMVFVLIFFALFPFEEYKINITKKMIYDLSIQNFIIFILFIVASFTDFLDGYLARKFRAVSNYGKLIDPLADKMLVNTTLIIFTANGAIPVLITILFICRDLLVDGLRMLMLEKKVVIAASKLGKLKTILQMIGLSLVILNLRSEKLDIPLYLISLALVASLVAMIDYLYKNIKVLINEKSN